MRSQPAPARTVYLLCPSWHGATLLGMLLGNHSRAMSLGDTLHSRWPFPCRCGERSDRCEFWREVRTRGGVDDDTAPLPRRPALLANPVFDQLAVTTLAAVASRANFVPRSFEATHKVNRALLDCAYARQPFDLFVDGCKSPTRYAALRADRTLTSAGIVHLLRDPRAFVAAAKHRGTDVAAAATSWARYHGSVGTIARLFGERVYVLRYEDFCAAPASELERLQDWLELSCESLLHAFRGSAHWTGSGSVNDFDGTVRQSERWRGALDDAELAAVAARTHRVAARFGYTSEQA